MVDRISRNYIHYSAYRQHNNSTQVSNYSYAARQLHSVINQSGRSESSLAYNKKAMENSIIQANEETERIKSAYSPVSYSYPPTVTETQNQGYPYLGLNVDIKA